MKKLQKTFVIPASAVAGMCLFAGSAMALDMSIYGVGHLSLDSNNDGEDTQLYVASNSSRLGFKGENELAKGMKIIFQYESGVDLSGRGENDGNAGAANNANSFFTTARDSYLGVSGKFGQIITGRLPALNQWVYDYNLFADQVGDLGNIWGASGLPARANGTLAYATPDMGNNLDLQFSYTPESGVANGDAMIAGVKYQWKKLKLGGAYGSFGQGTANQDHTVMAITASYARDAFTIGGGYQSESDMGGTSGNDRNSITLGASYQLSEAGKLKVQYAASAADAVDADASMLALGYDHAIDKATTVYVAYASTSNDPNAAFTANNYGHGQTVVPLAGNDPSSISIGVVYAFDAGLSR